MRAHISKHPRFTSKDAYVSCTLLVPDQCRYPSVSSRYFPVGVDVSVPTRTVGNASARRAAATAGCAVSLRNFGQAEPKRVDHVDGNQSCSKLGQNGEYRPLR